MCVGAVHACVRSPGCVLSFFNNLNTHIIGAEVTTRSAKVTSKTASATDAMRTCLESWHIPLHSPLKMRLTQAASSTCRSLHKGGRALFQKSPEEFYMMRIRPRKRRRLRRSQVSPLPQSSSSHMTQHRRPLYQRVQLCHDFGCLRCRCAREVVVKYMICETTAVVMRAWCTRSATSANARR